MDSCKKESIEMGAKNFISCKIDGESFGHDNLVAVPYAEYDAAASPTSLKIVTKTATNQLTIFIYGQKGDTGTFCFGEKVPGFYYHFAVIISHSEGTPVDYGKDSWFAIGKADPEGHSEGSVTITRCDTVNHQIEGSFGGIFYNSDRKTSKVITEGGFSLSLITLR